MSVDLMKFEVKPGYFQRDIAKKSGSLVLQLASSSDAFYFPTYSQLVRKAWLHHPEDDSLQTVETANPHITDENMRIVEALSILGDVKARNMGQRAVSSYFLTFMPRGVLVPQENAIDSTVGFALLGNGTLNVYDGDTITEREHLEPGDMFALEPGVKHNLAASDDEFVVMVLNTSQTPA